MKYGAIIKEDRFEKFLEFDTQEDCKSWIRNYGTKTEYRLIEFQDIEVKTEVKIEFKRPMASRIL
jgi:hypothetical protein